MPIRLLDVPFRGVAPEALARWTAIPPAVAFDVIDRTGAMKGAVAPVCADVKLYAKVRTVKTMAADSAPIHAAMDALEAATRWRSTPAAMMIRRFSAGCWRNARSRTAALGWWPMAGCRTRPNFANSAWPVFSHAIVPSCSQKGVRRRDRWRHPCSGCVIRLGVLLLGDDDGVAVAPLARAYALLAKAAAKFACEAGIVAQMTASERLSDLPRQAC